MMTDCPKEFEDKITVSPWALLGMGAFAWGMSSLVPVAAFGREFPLKEWLDVYTFVAKALQGACLLWFILAIGIRISEVVTGWLQEWRAHLRIANRYFLLYAGGMALVVALLSAIYLGLEAMGLISVGLEDALEGAAGAGGKMSELRSLLGVSFSRFMMSVLVTCGIAPVIEEVFFRRFLFVALRKRMAFVWALLLTTIAFMSVHSNPALGAIGGIYLGYVYEKGKSLPANILVHACVNSVVTFFAFFSRS